MTWRRGRKTPPAPAPRPARRALTDDDLSSFLSAAEHRSTGVSPSIYDLEKMCHELLPFAPIEARSTLRQLQWLMNASDRYLQAGWEHPWRK